jgi:hypothetical protein
MVVDLIMDVADPDPCVRKLSVLQMAQEILHNQYVEHKMKLHNEWALTAATVWKNQGRKWDYPELPAYPNTQDVVQAAQVLWQFLHDAHESPPQDTDCVPEQVSDLVPSSVPEQVPDLVPPSVPEHVPEVEQSHVPESVPEQIVEQVPDIVDNLPQDHAQISNRVDSTLTDPVTQPEDAENTRLGLLPSWILRSNRA